MWGSVWLYAYTLGMTRSRRLEQRIREDWAFRYLAAGATPDHGTLNDFRRRQARALNDVFTPVVELARNAKRGKLGHVAIDSTRIAANASRNRIDTEPALRNARARIRRDIRRWQRQCDAEDPHEGAGSAMGREAIVRLEQQLAQIPERLERLRKSGLPKLSRSDPDSRFLLERGGFTLGYTAMLAVSEDHWIVAQQVTQDTNDNEALLPMVDRVEQQCGEKPQQASGDSGFFSLENWKALEEREIDAYVPDWNLACWWNRGGRLRQRASNPAHQRMRRHDACSPGRAALRGTVARIASPPRAGCASQPFNDYGRPVFCSGRSAHFRPGTVRQCLLWTAACPEQSRREPAEGKGL